MGAPGWRRRSPEIPAPHSAEADPVQRLLAFAYLQAQKGQREATEELRKDAEALSAVLAAQGQIAAAHFDLDQTLGFIAEGARRLTGSGGAAIALREDGKVVCRGRSGLIAPELGARLNPESGISGECLASGEVQLCDDTEHDPRVDVWVCRNLGIRSILAVPLRRQQDVLGIIVVFSGWAGVFGERDIRALKLLAGLVIEALWSHEVHEREAPAFEASLAAPAQAEDISADLDRLLESMPALPEPQISPVVELAAARDAQAPVTVEAELPVPAFAVLAPAQPRRLGRTLAVVAVAVLAGCTLGGLGLRTHLRQLFHHRTAPAPAPVGTPVVPRVSPPPEPLISAPDARAGTDAAPQVSSGPAPASPSQLLAVRSWSKPEETTIALFLQAPARWESGMAKDPERIYFDLENTQLAPDMLGKSREGLAVQVNDGLVNRVRVGMRENSAVRIVIDLAAPAEYSAVPSTTEPYRLMIAIRAIQAPSNRPIPGPPAKQSPASPGASSNHAVLGRRPKIVIDPGHGGTEDGAIGHGGLKEKDLTLEISRRLGDMLSHRLGAEVIYTRTADVAVPLEARAAIANQAGADLFISVHANSSDDPGSRGVETFYVSRSPSPVSITGRESASKAGALTPAAEEQKISQSHKLAADVQRALYQAVEGERGVLNRGVKQAPFVVLLDAAMPSILAEVGFVTSPLDEQKLSTAEGQQAVADALYRGIASYVSSARQGKVMASLGGHQGN